MEEEELEPEILRLCNDLLLSSSPASWQIALAHLQTAVQTAGPAASSPLLRFLHHPHLPDRVLDALAQSISRCCGSCSAPASTLTFTFSPSLRIQVKEMDYVKGGLGWRVWGTALLLSRRVVELQKSFQGKRVLELGSGCGLCGLLVAKLGAAEVILSDCVPDILVNLCDNAFLLAASMSLSETLEFSTARPVDDLNTSTDIIYKNRFDYAYGGAVGVVSDAYSCMVRVRLLNWLDDTQELPKLLEMDESDTFYPKLDINDVFDWVIGSDLIYNHDSVQSLAAVIQRRLSNVQGRGLFALPVRETKELDFFLEELAKLGMDTNVDYCSEQEWKNCLAVMGAVEEGGTVHGIDHYEGGLVIISVTHTL